jgi:hypothetical protein
MIIFNIISLMQRWKEMLPEKEKEWAMTAMRKLKRQVCRTKGAS